MNQEEIITTALSYLEQHLNGGRGHMDQEPYKRDIFNLFREAYKNKYFDSSSSPLLTGDAFRDALVARWFTDDEKEDEKTRLLEQLVRKWDAWRYAWDHYNN